MNRFVLLSIVLFFSISACTVYREYPIDVYQPGEIAIPPDVQNVALIYRNFNYPGDTLKHYYKDDYRLKRARNEPKNLDSILVKICLNEMAGKFKTNKTFNQVKVLPYDLFKKHSGAKLPALNFELVKKLTTSSQTDLLISLETFSYFFSEYSGNLETPESNEVITAAVWAVYDPMTEKLIERKAMIDTVFWNGYDEQGNYQKKTILPPRETALRIASQLAGENYTKRFIASWETVNRMYSIPPLPDFSEAAYYVEEGKWENAINLWKKYASDKNGKLAINARYNLALAYEMKDDLETAVKWAAAAKKLALDFRSKEDLNIILLYQKILDKRVKDIERLNQN